MNEEFYRADPERYLDRRLSGLMLAISQSPETEAVLNGGLEYGTLKMSGSLFADEDTGVEIEKYAALESTNLLHHAAECMLRLYFGHAEQPECPWLEVSRLRAPSRFKEKLEALLCSMDEPETKEQIVTAFYGSPDSQRLGVDIPQDTWEGAKTGLIDLVGYCAKFLLEDAGLYNSTKHGLAVIGGNHGLRLHLDEEELDEGEVVPDISTDGPALVHLDQAVSTETGSRRWVKRLRFVRADSNLALTKIISRYIGTLWGVARFRYTANGKPFNLAVFDREAIGKAVTAGIDRDKTFGFDGMTYELAYYVDREAPE